MSTAETNVQSDQVTQARLHYMDNLRALAMLLGVLFHAALAYGPLFQYGWLTSAADHHVAFDVVSWFSHLFRMPLFFLIAGFFALMLIEKRGYAGMLKNRSVRILLPFLLFLPALLILVGQVVEWAMTHVENPSPVLAFVKMMANMPNADSPPFSTMHMWFLYYLYLFVLVIVLAERTGALEWRIWQWLCGPFGMLVLLPLLMVPALMTVHVPHPAPDKWYPQLWAFGFYGWFFLAGALLYRRPAMLTQLLPYRHWMLLVALGLYAWFYWQLPEVFTGPMLMLLMQPKPFSWAHLPVAAAEAWIAVYMTWYCLILGQRYLSRQSRIMKLVADSSYWIYLIHLPLLFLIQFYLLDSGLNVWVQFLLSSGLTFLIGMVSYLLLVRHTPVGWLLNGRKNRGQRMADPANDQ